MSELTSLMDGLECEISLRFAGGEFSSFFGCLDNDKWDECNAEFVSDRFLRHRHATEILLVFIYSMLNIIRGSLLLDMATAILLLQRM